MWRYKLPAGQSDWCENIDRPTAIFMEQFFARVHAFVQAVTFMEQFFAL